MNAVTNQTGAHHLFFTRACEDLGYSIRSMEPQRGLVLVEDGRRRFAMLRGRIPLNSRTACELAASKALCSRLLATAGFHTPRERCFVVCSTLPAEAAAEIVRFAETVGYPLFVKPESGSLGSFAKRVQSPGEVIRQAETLAIKYRHALVQEWIQANEYRLFLLAGEIIFSYRRHVAAVHGDGLLSFAQLLDKAKSERPLLKPDYGIDREWILEQLLGNGLTWRTVVPEGLKIELATVASLSNGGTADDLRLGASKACQDWARSLASLFPLKVCSVDLFAPGGLHHPEGFIVIDVNSNPMLASLFGLGRGDLGVAIWKKILRLRMAEEDRTSVRDSPRPSPGLQAASNGGSPDTL